jgi:hypothetical protein
MVWLAMGWALAKTVACLAKSLRGQRAVVWTAAQFPIAVTVVR